MQALAWCEIILQGVGNALAILRYAEGTLRGEETPGTCVTFVCIHELVRVCCQLGAAFDHSWKLILVMCSLTHCIVVQTPF
jgi:hypothetical protein